MFQLLTDDIGPLKLMWSIAHGTPGLPGPELLVQSHSNMRFLMTIVEEEDEWT